MKKALQGLGVGAGAALAALLFWLAGWLDGFEARTWNWRVRLLAREGAETSRVRLILLDQQSLDWGANVSGLSWPWPREVYQPLVDFCLRQGARSIAFDVLYTEPSKYGVADDQLLGQAAAQAGNFVTAVFLGHETGSLTNWPDWPLPAGPEIVFDVRPDWLTRAWLPRATLPIPELATNAAVLANVQAMPDADGVYRRILPFQEFDGRLLPALGVGALLAAEPDTVVRLRRGSMQLGHRLVPLDRQGRVLLRFRGPSRTHRAFSAAAVIESELLVQAGEAPTVPEDAFRDCHVFFGFSAPGLFDLRPTPVSGVYPGVEIHATLLDNILSGDSMRDVPGWLTVLMTLFLGALAGLAVRFGRHARDNLLVMLAAMPLPAAVCLAAYQAGWWLPFMGPALAVALALIGGVLVNYATEGRQKRFIRSAFRQYLSEDVIRELVNHPERLTLGGEQRTLSVFFSDLQGFTGISEKLEPRQLTSLLNEYLTAMTDIIQGEGGTVDKYEGDAIIAFWNAPLPQDDHAVRAVRAALRCQACLAEMRGDLRRRYGNDLFMRIGVNTGPVVVGNMGSHNRFNYTILGDAANLAARLEGINKQFDSYTLISEYTQSAISDADHMATREISRVMVVGRKAPVRVFEPMTAEDRAARRVILDKFAAALSEFYAGDFPAAFEKFAELQGADAVAGAYCRKCRALTQNPPRAWAGVWEMTEK